MTFFLLAVLVLVLILSNDVLVHVLLLLTMFNLEFGKSSLTITKANQHHLALELTYSDCCIVPDIRFREQ